MSKWAKNAASAWQARCSLALTVQPILMGYLLIGRIASPRIGPLIDDRLPPLPLFAHCEKAVGSEIIQLGRFGEAGADPEAGRRGIASIQSRPLSGLPGQGVTYI